MSKKTKQNEITRAKSSNRLSYIVAKSFHNPIVEKNEDGEYAPIGNFVSNVQQLVE